MQMKAVRQLVDTEMKSVDQCIAQQFGSDVGLIKKLSQHIFTSGGKRLRPILVLLSAKAFSFKGQQHIDLAAIVELIHTATLVHDDVVDKSSMRRGKKTANFIWGNEASVLVGDFMYSRAFQMMVKLESLSIMSILADAANIIAEGEVMQLNNCHDASTNEQQYLETIARKTATLFKAAAELGAMISDQPVSTTKAMADYGLHLGMAFQLIDDALDYGVSTENIGKNIGDDLAEGKPTLPLIHALKHGDSKQKLLIEQAIEKGETAQIKLIQQAIADTGAIEYTFEAASKQVLLAQQQLHVINNKEYKTALEGLADFALKRQF